ncbi:MAG: thiamine diphosphokinase [Candidatus Symbiothrix sp.]|jgi:thiamine pyrophosphokinase|nr:thiamine diphosphokinase [Candidatus Symbiothrix sp.]
MMNSKLITLTKKYSTVVLANGSFPTHDIPLNILRNAERVICCDGAAENLLAFGREPDFVVGDLDSLPADLKLRYASRLQHFAEQETNDLTKSVRFCVANGWTPLAVLGATGKREDHTLGNLSLLTDYAEYADLQAYTDHGVFTPQLQSANYESFIGQQVSVFSLTNDTVFTFGGLRYPVVQRRLTSWWQASLNEALGTRFSIEMTEGKALIFRKY